MPRTSRGISRMGIVKRRKCVMAYNQSAKLKGNIAAIRIALGRENDQPLSAEEINILSGYAGFGGLKQVLFSGDYQQWEADGASMSDLKLYEETQKLYDTLKQKLSEREFQMALDAIRSNVLTGFYTPSFIPDLIFQNLKEKGIEVKSVYEPSAGAGVFISSALKHVEGLEKIEAVEKDFVTGAVLHTLSDSWPVSSKVHIASFEESPRDTDGTFDLVISNIPFGNLRVYDPSISSTKLKENIHSYFFVRGIDKLREGGILAFLTTDGFLNSPGNRSAREHLFGKADFISLAALPDNLMKESASTEAPTHLLIVQRNSSKTALSPEEKLLCQTIEASNQFGNYTVNAYLDANTGLYLGDQVYPGRDQYGEAHVRNWQEADMDQFASRYQALLRLDFGRIDLARFRQLPEQTVDQAPVDQLRLRPQPQSVERKSMIQLGLFDSIEPQHLSRAQAYLDKKDLEKVIAESARFLGVIRLDHPGNQEAIVLIAARHLKSRRFMYRINSNTYQIPSSAKWANAEEFSAQIKTLSVQLKYYKHAYHFEGDSEIEAGLNLNPLPLGSYPNLKFFHQEGSLVMYEGRVGQLTDVDHKVGKAVFEPFKAQGRREFFERYITLRDEFLGLNRAGMPTDDHESIDEAKLKDLNDQYDRFVKDFGLLHHKANLRLIGQDEIHGPLTLAGLERRNGEGYEKSDLLTGILYSQPEEIRTENPMEALAISLNEYGRINLNHMVRITGSSPESLLTALSEQLLINPESGEWETRDKYLSGNVHEKLETAKLQVAAFPENEEYKRSLEEIEAIQPERIPFELLEFNLGERWIPLDFYQDFASKFFDQQVSLTYLPSVDLYKMTNKPTSVTMTKEFQVIPKSGTPMLGDDLLEHAFQNTSPYFSYELPHLPGEKPRRVPDNDAIQLAFKKIEDIRQGFTDWLRNLPEEKRESLTDLYNNTFNCFVQREYDGSHLTFSGLDMQGLNITELHSSQRDATWRIMQERGGVIDHAPGTGKTLIMVLASQEMRRLGLANKPVILALKANVDEVAKTFRRAYPTKRLLAPKPNEFSAKTRHRIFREIKYNRWDCIILTHDQFGKITQSPAIQEEILGEELLNVERDLETVKKLGGSISKSILRGLEIRKNNLSVKLKQVSDSIKSHQDEGFDFDSLGIDHIFLDEGHKFKNLTFTTRHNRVAGLGNTEGNQKTLNLLFAIRSLQKRFDQDNCATSLTGTPISNSLTELYLLFKYFKPRALAKQGIESFDAWAAVFAKKTTEFEFNITNQIVAKERFRLFIKVPEIQMFYNEMTDYKTAKHINLDVPQMEEHLINLKPTPQQEEFIARLIAYAKTGTGRYIGRPELGPEDDKARMLIATNYAKKMAIDMRLISERYGDHENNKISACAKQVAELYHKYNEHKGTQLIFSDIGTPRPDGFNVYDAMKEKLISQYGIPEKEISFIHDWPDEKKAELFHKMNTGQIRVLIGSTEKAGTGLNIQRLLVAMHHLDIPWRPSDLEQRIFRGVRTGNWIAKNICDNKVLNFIYATERSLDGYKFNLLKHKSTFIKQLKEGKLSVRRIDEGAMDEFGGSFAQYTAILSGNTSLLERDKLDGKINALENLRMAHFKHVNHTKRELDSYASRIIRMEKVIRHLDQDEQFLREQLLTDKKGTTLYPLKLVEHPKLTDQESIGKKILELEDTWLPVNDVDTSKKIGELYGFDLYINRKLPFAYRSHEEGYNTFFAKREGSEIIYTHNNGVMSSNNTKTVVNHFVQALEKIPALRDYEQQEKAKLEALVPGMKALCERPFDKDAQLADLKKELAQLDLKIMVELKQAGDSTEVDFDTICFNDDDPEPDLQLAFLHGGRSQQGVEIKASETIEKKQRTRVKR